MNHTSGLEKVVLKVDEPGDYSIILTDPSTSLHYTVTTHMAGDQISFKHIRNHSVFHDFKIDLEAFEYMDKGKERVLLQNLF